MRIPRWSLLAAATALALPVAGPAFATAAGDADVTFLSALAASFSSGETCEDEVGSDAEGDPQGEEDAFAELSDTPTEGVDPCAEEHDDEAAGGDTDPDEPVGDEASEEEDPGEAPDPEVDDDLSEDEATDEEPAPESEQLTHGALVSTVARCAPRGPEARGRFERNHGAFVSAAAQGVELEVLGETFDLSTPEGAEALCDFVADPPEQDDEEPGTTEEPDPEVESQQSADAHPGKAERPANPGRGNGKAADKAGSAATPAGKGVGHTDEKGGNGGGPPPHAGPARGGGKGGGPNR